MSRVIERLQKLAKPAAQPMGFRAAARLESTSMVLIASLSQPEAASAASASADAVLIHQKKLSPKDLNLHHLIQAIGDTPWGVWGRGVSGKVISQLVEMGCDFLILDAVDAPISVLQERVLGKILEVESPVDESWVGTLAYLSLDAVMVEGGDEPFPTLQSLIACYQVANLLHKPLLVATPPTLTDSDLKALWMAGVDGVVWDTEGVEIEKRLPELRQAIEALPPATKRQGKKPDVLLPHLGGELEEEE